MPKLQLKRTPGEEAEREWRRARKKAKKARRSQRSPSTSSSERGQRADDVPTSAKPPDYQTILAELEEKRFRQKLEDAMEDDLAGGYGGAHLDNLEADFNAYTPYIPHRWGGTSSVEHVYDYDWDGLDKMDPRYMDDDTYAEYMRRGMWKQTHKAEIEEEDRRKKAREERKQKERAAKEEVKRLEREENARRAARREVKQLRRLREARDDYDARWAKFLAGGPVDTGARLIAFSEVPWPIQHHSDSFMDLDALTVDAISSFIFISLPSSGNGETSIRKAKRDLLRATLLRFHPDKFNSKILPHVEAKDRDNVLEGAVVVTRSLNSLIESLGSDK